MNKHLNTRFASLFITLIAITITGCESKPKVAMPDVQPNEKEVAAIAQSDMVGLPAPNFTLPSDQGGNVTLTDLRGQWVVLYFYPKDDTPGCTCQATEFTDHQESFNLLNTVILGISQDSIDSHAAFREKHDLGINLLSDPTHNVMSVYGAWTENDQGKGRTLRSTVIINPSGEIVAHYPVAVPEGHAERILAKVITLQSVAAK